MNLQNFRTLKEFKILNSLKTFRLVVTYMWRKSTNFITHFILSSFAEYSSSGESGGASSAAFVERKHQSRELNTAPEPYYGKVCHSDESQLSTAGKKMYCCDAFNR